MKQYLLTYLKGIAMGAADVVPGVSGGTIAFISGIYQRWITALANIDTRAVKLFFTGQFRAFWHHIDGGFLLSLAAGIATAVFSLAKIIRQLLETQPVLVWSFFFGLIAASVYFLGRTVIWRGREAVLAVIGCVLAVIISLLPAGNSEALSLPYLFFCGALAIIAMVLPGISGAFILVLLGAYTTVLGAVHPLNITVLAVLAAGTVCGLAVFSRLLRWLFKHYHNAAIALMTGFIAGSLVKIWPWKITGHNVLPSALEHPQLPAALALIVTGFVLIFVLETAAAKLQKR